MHRQLPYLPSKKYPPPRPPPALCTYWLQWYSQPAFALLALQALFSPGEWNFQFPASLCCSYPSWNSPFRMQVIVFIHSNLDCCLHKQVKTSLFPPEISHLVNGIITLFLLSPNTGSSYSFYQQTIHLVFSILNHLELMRSHKRLKCPVMLETLDLCLVRMPLFFHSFFKLEKAAG